VCTHKRSLGLNSPGAFAERVAVPAAFVHPVPPEIHMLDAVGLEPLAVAVHAVGVGRVSADDPVAVIGCGTEGLLIAQVAAARGARVLAADIRTEALARAERLGALRVIQVSSDGRLEDSTARMTADWSPVVVFEAAGSASAVDLALQMVDNGGSVVLVGLGVKAVPVVPLRFVRRGLSLLGSLIYDHPVDFLHAIDLVRQGEVKPSVHVTHVLDLAETAEALALVASGGTGKVVLDVRGVLEGQAPAATRGSACDVR
jgi:threonine dehydrogenase-like Zn-dependent dehydrogenase